MKLTKTANTQLKPGMTLIEITVVILVLLTLISVLFIGANIYKKGADRAACILNIRNVQQAVRSHQNLFTKVAEPATAAEDIEFATEIYSSVDANGVVTTERYLVEPTCPSAGTYSGVTKYPATGTVILSCTLAGTDDHVPSETAGW